MTKVLASYKEPTGKRYAVTGERIVNRNPETGEFEVERVVLYESDYLELAQLAFEMNDQPWRKAMLIDRFPSFSDPE